MIKCCCGREGRGQLYYPSSIIHIIIVIIIIIIIIREKKDLVVWRLQWPRRKKKSNDKIKISVEKTKNEKQIRLPALFMHGAS